MVIARLLAVGLLSASLNAGAQAGGFPTSNLVVQATHRNWPDGSPVESGGQNYPTDIYVVDVNSKHVRNLTHDGPTNYLTGWLPESQRILYESVPSDRMRRGPSRIFSIKADGSGRRQLASGKGELLPKLSPDTHRILFARGRWLYVMRNDGTHKTPLAQPSFGYYYPPTDGYDAAWSPDGKRIAFVRGFAKTKYDLGANPRSAIYVVNADGTGLRRLTKVRPKVQTMNPVWAPGGRRIAFVEQSDVGLVTQNRVYVMHADGTHVKRLKLPDNTYHWFWLSGDRIAYEVGSGRLHSIDADGTGKPQTLAGRIRIGGDLWITSGRSAGSWPVSPDGKWIAWVFGGGDLWIENLDGTHRRLVTRICCPLSSLEWAGK